MLGVRIPPQALLFNQQIFARVTSTRERVPGQRRSFQKRDVVGSNPLAGKKEAEIDL
jgi:hypothetical protein